MRSATRKKIGKDDDYKAFIASLPCVCCWIETWKRILSGAFTWDAWIPFAGRMQDGDVQQSPTEVAHVGERGLSQKCSDRETIPLCGIEHHREGKFSGHKLGKNFWAHWGIDRDALIAKLNERFQEEQ